MAALRRCRWVGRTCFAPDEQALYFAYDVLATNYPGWGLNEIRQMTQRQRSHFLKVIQWKRDRQRV